MVEDSFHESDRGPPSPVDRVLRRIDAHRSLPAPGAPKVAALGPPSAVADERQAAREPSADIVVSPGRMYVTVELPGADRETLEVAATDRRLTIHALREDGGVFHREIELPSPVESEAIAATYRNGVLDVTLPRRRGHPIRVRKGEGHV